MLAAQPIEVRHPDWRDFYAGNVCQHQARIGSVIIGLAYASPITLLQKSYLDRRGIRYKRRECLNARRARVYYPDGSHLAYPVRSGADLLLIHQRTATILPAS